MDEHAPRLFKKKGATINRLFPLPANGILAMFPFVASKRWLAHGQSTPGAPEM